MNKNASYGGLTQEKAKKLQQMYGKNELNPDSRKTTWKIISGAIGEPIFLLLMSASAIYFLLGEAGEGMIMMAFVLGVVFLDVLQEYKTDKALNALNKLSQPMITVLRDGKSQWISSVDLVPGDICFVEEGFRIPADGYVLSSHDFCINESLLTGESGDVWKSSVQDINLIKMPIKPMLTAMELEREDYCYAGTMVVQGNATMLVDKIGAMTAYGEIGLGLVTAPDKITPLQIQMKNLTKTCTYIAVILFALVFIITFSNLDTGTLQHRMIQSFLSGIVLSLSMIPAEFPVILTVFLSMGSLRLLKKHGLIRKLHAVETLGSVSVICVDKTGTITKNQMEVVEKWSNKCDEQLLFQIAGLACDSSPHEAMDKAILNYCSSLGIDNEKLFEKTFIKGYPFTQECKTMAHVWRDHNEIVIAVKGSPEWILGHSNLTSSQRKHVEEKAWTMAKKGLRVIAVGKMMIESEDILPDALQECEFTFLGLLGLMDPPKEHLAENIRMCDQAGIRVIMITGDNGITAAAIADTIHFQGDGTIINGSQLAEMSDEKLQEIVRKVNIFARVIPEQKLRIVKALQKNGALVAMTGDGVNDALALKNADIGIAMGLRGSEVTRESADLVLLDDNFSTIVESIQDGRRIYENIRKAIGYVFSIHIPIAFICLFGPLLGIQPEKLMLLPLHVVLLELIMNPVCSIILERQPAETNIMKKGPRCQNEKLLTGRVIRKSIVQGFCIFISSFGSYYYLLLQNPENVILARTVGLSILIISNLFLILVNCSNTEYAYESFIKIIKDKGIISVCIATIGLYITIIYSPLSKLLMLESLHLTQLVTTIVVSFIFIMWYDFVKAVKIHRGYKAK